MNEFIFSGRVPSSKSLWNRALIVKSFYPELKIKGETSAADVQLMKKAVQGLAEGITHFDCGKAGTVLRFLALRLSREKGTFYLTGDPRLFERPQESLIQILRQLGCFVEAQTNKIVLNSEGWNSQGDGLYIQCEKSSQFASAFLLSCWRLPKKIFFALSFKKASFAYFQMTLEFLTRLGLNIESSGNDYVVHPSSVLSFSSIDIPADADCAFAVGALAALLGEAHIVNFDLSCFQPSNKFLELLKQMGAGVEYSSGVLKIYKKEKLKGIRTDLNNCPDLFPVLAFLGAMSEGSSELRGASQLAYKESHRIEKVSEFLRGLAVEHEVFKDGLFIRGVSKGLSKRFFYDTDKDHRLAMMGGLAQAMGFPVDLSGKSAVEKSFPEFWKILDF